MTQLKAADEQTKQVEDKKKYVDILREILNDRGLNDKSFVSMYQL